MRIATRRTLIDLAWFALWMAATFFGVFTLIFAITPR